jgi:glutathione S-transferase
MALELFHAHNSTCSQKVRLCLAEKGIRDWINRPLDIPSAKISRLGINPMGSSLPSVTMVDRSSNRQ